MEFIQRKSASLQSTRSAFAIYLALLLAIASSADAQVLYGTITGNATDPTGAVSYTLSLWQKLTRVLEYPELELSTNLAENSMRPVALGRKNWIHIGSAEAGPTIAAILSIVESCRRLKIPVRNYLADILPGLAATSLRRAADLTPSRWIANRS